ncbi:MULTISPECIES: 6,7-dimethyl-8-ribityllumazine synthase [Nitrosomonas]|jgi:6,7-dimethyl-8-ribityllumazine synthase|uniref:6,7-dimethyl-8-ribityllumazine synthase n=1 Tax=Nitrosomonas oligotropha TaxID=42354 RepID=A0A1H8IY10_9PROT|nr:6,7-dimethyl-8-ribityllumazine synthase [Nitrosomonas oligotropha]MBK7490666.1 6,7-dimethyl-8-ribityllumazine synthase [Nitrosomonas sp.]NBQ70312.1 6,7-dimethyl-8-ribityllumazine synthase [Nitrosomonadaceae bacterium]MBP9100516.1 6,7-dimethyl-8-ribityllumazine synthase [Nitrosomonas sp.]MBX9635952.1 6,7-dimethyl-8-ribityllumazine synthase [Nitrosomonas sp.]PTQ66340.1 6,7-dimethyl-8-ribityllumazine synthase [Nitrosomonas oligotropha]
MPYYDEILEFEPNLDGSDLRIGIVMSRFNIDIGEGLLGACTAELKRNGVLDSNVLIATVPGALEIPLTLKRMAMSDQFDALIALGAVIRGDTYHFEVVANESARGILMVQLEAEIPVANGVLTTDDEDQAIARMSTKGTESAQVALEMANLHIKIDEIDL